MENLHLTEMLRFNNDCSEAPVQLEDSVEWKGVQFRNGVQHIDRNTD